MPNLRRAAMSALASACLASACLVSNSPLRAEDAAAGPTPFLSSPGTDTFASNLIDVEVRGPGGTRIGEIEDLVLDASGQVRAVMIAAGLRAGANERHVLVQFTALHLTRGDDGKRQAELDVTPEQLKAAPTIPYRSGWND